VYARFQKSWILFLGESEIDSIGRFAEHLAGLVLFDNGYVERAYTNVAALLELKIMNAVRIPKSG
jgi:hypothetical protein